MTKKRSFRKAVALAGAAAILLATAGPQGARAATRTVCSVGCDHASIGAAIVSAAAGDTISVQTGIYAEHGLTVDHDLTIQGVGWGDVTVDAQQLGRVFVVTSGVTARISGMTIANGRVTDDGAAGIQNFGNLTLDGVVVTGNANVKATNDYLYGGGVFNMGTLTMSNSQVTGNSSVYNGGGVYAYFGTTTRLTDVLVQGNTLTGPNGAGAGISVNSDAGTYASTLVLERVTVDGNSGGYTGGGIWFQGEGTVTITDSTITGNGGVGGYGAGVSIGAFTALTMSGSRVSHNDAGANYGGGLAIAHGGAAQLTNVTVAANTASQGAGIFVSGPLTLNNVTISGNAATADGGGIYAPTQDVTVRNSILGGNTAGVAGADCSGFLTSAGHNLVESVGGCTVTTLATDVTGVAPGLENLWENGGPTATMALQPGSPAIDAGDPATCAAVDQRGFPRPLDGNRDGGAACDVGAHEQGSRLAVLSTASGDGWVLESSEAASAGGTRNAKATTLRVGDDALDRQYRSLLSFDTSGLPDGAYVQRLDLRVKRASVTGKSPFVTHGKLLADVRGPFFGAGATLGLDDFAQAGQRNAACVVGAVPAASWHRATCAPAALAFVNDTGTTQLRLRFAKDDNDDGGADYLSLWSGNAPVASDRPALEVYYLP